MELWDIMQLYGTIVLRVFSKVTYMLGSPIMPEGLYQPSMGLLWDLIGVDLWSLSVWEDVFGFNPSTLTYGEAIFGLAGIVMVISLVKWLIDLIN